MTIHVGCGVSVAPDLVEGDIDGDALMTGRYVGAALTSRSGHRRRDDVGQSINATDRLPRIAFIRPDRPFGVNSGSWSESPPLRSCDRSVPLFLCIAKVTL